MAATPITTSARYLPEGTVKFYWVPSMSNYLSPTSAELNTGSTDLTPEIAEAGDWAITSEAVDTPDLATTFTSQIPGKVSVDGTTLTFYADSTSVDVRATLARNTTGYIVKFGAGNVTGRKCDVFPVKVGSLGKGTSIGDPATIEVTFYVTKIPAEDFTIPA